jgi:hypothetical protein
MAMDSVPPQLPRDLSDLIAGGPPRAAVEAIKLRYGVTMPAAMKVISNVLAGLPANAQTQQDETWLVNWLGPLEAGFKQRHFRGLPPQLTGGIDKRVPDPPPVLLIMVLSGVSATLYRYSADGHSAGNTFHESRGAAIYQAEAEYGSALTGWVPVVSKSHRRPSAYARELILARQVG